MKILELFKKQAKAGTMTQEEVQVMELVKDKTPNQIVQEIHDAFDSAQERLLTEAKAMLSGENTEIGERAKKIGFTNTPAAKKFDSLVKTKQQAEMIEYYKMAYPFLKFLTIEEMERICNKYGLIYAEAHRYIKDIPEKNIRDIETAQPLKRKDSQYGSYDVNFEGSYMRGISGYAGNSGPIGISGGGGASGEILVWSGGGGGSWMTKMTENVVSSLLPVQEPEKIEAPKKSQEEFDNEIVEVGLSICAPKHHFNLQGATKQGIRYIEDPIVFRYVYGGVQVLTKWGLEAEDPELFVDRMN